MNVNNLNVTSNINTISINGQEYPVNFTGCHGNINNFELVLNKQQNGLIVSSNGNYLNTNNSINPYISESLPLCIITTVENDKSVFGVISYNPNNSENYSYRVNSLGEGGIWITNKNGNLENGDYIVSSNIPGYGQKQTLNENILCNFTVAKITTNCDFSLDKKVKKKVKLLNNKIVYNSDNKIIYENELDEYGNIIYDYIFETRFLDEDGNILENENEYNIRLKNGENVYIACFVGCTYHCG